MQLIEPVEKHNSTRFTDKVMPKACLALKHCQKHIVQMEEKKRHLFVNPNGSEYSKNKHNEAKRNKIQNEGRQWTTDENLKEKKNYL